MAVVGGLLGSALSLAGGLVGQALFGGKKKAEPKAATPAMTVAGPRASSVALDALSSRQGAAANQRTGLGGVESSTRAKKQLLGQ